MGIYINSLPLKPGVFMVKIKEKRKHREAGIKAWKTIRGQKRKEVARFKLVIYPLFQVKNNPV